MVKYNSDGFRDSDDLGDFDDLGDSDYSNHVEFRETGASGKSFNSGESLPGL